MMVKHILSKINIENLIFCGRWLLAPMYVGLLLGEAVYVYRFTVEVWHILCQFNVIKEEELLIAVLGLVDITMIANLITMVTLGGYSIFVKELSLSDKPQWLDHITTGTLKLKMQGAIVGVTSIHLLKSFINISHLPQEEVKQQLIIHAVFLASFFILAFVESLTHKEEAHE